MVGEAASESIYIGAGCFIVTISTMSVYLDYILIARLSNLDKAAQGHALPLALPNGNQSLH